jgi:hypothetical protein
MNQTEYEALANHSISPFVHRLYSLGFRRNIDYATGEVFVSFAGLCAALEYHPPRGSTEAFSRPSKDKVRHGIDVLKRCGLLKLVRKGSLKDNRPAVYCCVLASVNAKRDFCGQNEEPHESTTRAPQEHHDSKLLNNNEMVKNVVEFRKRDEPHIPDLPVQDRVYNAREDFFRRGDLVFNSQFKLMANQAKLGWDSEKLEALFAQFRVSAKDDGSSKLLSDWLVVWQRYCVNVYANNVIRGNDNEINQLSGNSRSFKENPTARALAESKRAAEYCAENGIDGSVLDRIITLSEGNA